jgi:predicted permease
MRTTLPVTRYETDDRIRLFSGALVDRIGHLPGVAAVGFANYLPMTERGEANWFDIEGRPAPRVADRPSSWTAVVGGGYFDAMGIPLLSGRLPGPADTEKTPLVFVIDEALARRFWPGQDPVGQRLVWRREGERVSGEIVGVVGSVRWIGMANEPQPTTYFWFPQAPGREMTVVTRALGDSSAIARGIAAQVSEIDPSQPFGDIHPVGDFVSANLAQPRFTMRLLGVFAAAALLLSAIGLYGVISFGVAQRTREIGVRVALGAQRSDVLGLVMRRGLTLVGAGIAVGLAGAMALGGVLAGLLYGVRSTDPTTLFAVALFLATVAMLATYLPARRAAQVDPVVALRAE